MAGRPGSPGARLAPALGLTKAPGAVPLLARGGLIPVGGTIRAIGHKWHPVLALPAASCARHMVIVGATGSGKTNLMIRLWAGWFTATLQAHRSGRGDRPLLVVLDCKGGRDARRKADRTRRLLYGAGARRVAIWPDEARLCLWDLPPDELAVLLYQMIGTGTGNAAYHADLLQAVITLAILAPCGPAGALTARLKKITTGQDSCILELEQRPAGICWGFKVVATLHAMQRLVPGQQLAEASW